MVAVLVLVIAVAVVQLGLFVHVRNSLTDVAGAAARYGALEGNSERQAQERAAVLVAREFGASYPADVSVSASTDAGGSRIITVRIVASVPLLGLLGPGGSLATEGRAMDEDAMFTEVSTDGTDVAP